MSDSFNESLHTIKYEWSMLEVLDAHEALDIQAETERIMAEEAKKSR